MDKTITPKPIAVMSSTIEKPKDFFVLAIMIIPPDYLFFKILKPNLLELNGTFKWLDK